MPLNAFQSSAELRHSVFEIAAVIGKLFVFEFEKVGYVVKRSNRLPYRECE
jgi:hypothetical protein